MKKEELFEVLGNLLRHMKAQCLPPVKAACLWKKERQPPKAGWNGGFPRYRFRLNR